MADKAKEKESAPVAPWHPFGDPARWDAAMERMMEEFFGRGTRSRWLDRWLKHDEMSIAAPAVDMFEEKDEIVVKAEIPGIDKDHVEVNLTDHVLTIRGEKKKEEEIERDNYYRSERSYGSFVRTLPLPTEVCADKVKATFNNGVLEVRLPKTEAAKAKEIKVKID